MSKVIIWNDKNIWQMNVLQWNWFYANDAEFKQAVEDYGIRCRAALDAEPERNAEEVFQEFHSRI